MEHPSQAVDERATEGTPFHEEGSITESTTDRGQWTRSAVVGGLILLVLVSFGRVLWNDFVTFDDPLFVLMNRNVNTGLSWSGFIWAFTHFHTSQWQPVTWLSHMLDCQLYGLEPMGHHLSSLIIHLLSSVMLFLILERMTGALWTSALQAAIFAVHPLRVESVSWIAERKDVLATFFWIATMGAYAAYARHPGRGRWTLVVLLFVLGLMSKPMVLTLPFALLLLDLWPLGRLSLPKLAGSQKTSPRAWVRGLVDSIRPLVYEKRLLFVLCLCSIVVTFLAQARGGAIANLQDFTISDRFKNVTVSTVRYLISYCWPDDLSVFYRYEAREYSWLIVGGSVLTLLVLTLGFLAEMRNRPWLIVGWLWYLGTLAPVIGLVQIGLQSRADRYTYIPSIGLGMIVVGLLTDLCHLLRIPFRWRALLSVMVLIVLGATTSAMVAHWRNSAALYRQALHVDEKNDFAHSALAAVFVYEGLHDKALVHYRRATELKPRNPLHWLELAKVLRIMGHHDEVIPCIKRSLSLDPSSEEARRCLADARARSTKVNTR